MSPNRREKIQLYGHLAKLEAPKAEHKVKVAHLSQQKIFHCASLNGPRTESRAEQNFAVIKVQLPLLYPAQKTVL